VEILSDRKRHQESLRPRKQWLHRTTVRRYLAHSKLKNRLRGTRTAPVQNRLIGPAPARWRSAAEPNRSRAARSGRFTRETQETSRRWNLSARRRFVMHSSSRRSAETRKRKLRQSEPPSRNIQWPS